MSGNTAAGEDEDQCNELNAAVNMLFWSHDMNQIQVDSDLTAIKYTKICSMLSSYVSRIYAPQGKCQKGTYESDGREADMVSLLYISEPNRCLVSLFWL